MTLNTDHYLRLKEIKGDWHEFESKALRREKEKQEKQQRDARRAAAAAKESGHDKDRKRPPSASTVQPESKRPHLESHAPTTGGESATVLLPAGENPAAKPAAEQIP